MTGPDRPDHAPADHEASHTPARSRDPEPAPAQPEPEPEPAGDVRRPGVPGGAQEREDDEWFPA